MKVIMHRDGSARVHRVMSSEEGLGSEVEPNTVSYLGYTFILTVYFDGGRNGQECEPKIVG